MRAAPLRAKHVYISVFVAAFRSGLGAMLMGFFATYASFTLTFLHKKDVQVFHDALSFERGRGLAAFYAPSHGGSKLSWHSIRQDNPGPAAFGY
jgi:hypothetical protein